MTWLGTALVAATLLGVSLQLPTGVPARAGAVAETVDTVAAAPHPSAARHPLDAGAVRIHPSRISLRTPNGVSHATLGFGPITPAPSGSSLARILRGTPAHEVFESPAALDTAAARSRNATAVWQDPGPALLVRRVTWGGVDVTIVGV
jgi:hypothetical protein